jgi:phosphoglycolate phosphatase
VSNSANESKHASGAQSRSASTHDLQMAQNAGTWGAGVSYGAHPVEALRDCAPLACFDSFAEFDTWLTPRLAN